MQKGREAGRTGVGQASAEDVGRRKEVGDRAYRRTAIGRLRRHRVGRGPAQFLLVGLFCFGLAHMTSDGPLTLARRRARGLPLPTRRSAGSAGTPGRTCRGSRWPRPSPTPRRSAFHRAARNCRRAGPPRRRCYSAVASGCRSSEPAAGRRAAVPRLLGARDSRRAGIQRSSGTRRGG